jgi:DNA-binding PucR family transcriptional regulator
LHVALAMRAAASDALPMLWDAVTRTFSSDACALRFEAGRVLALMPVSSNTVDLPVATRIEQWHQLVSVQIGPISVGRSATHAGPEGIQQAQEEAVRALALGERLRGPGFVTAYGEVFALDYAERLIEDDRLGGVYEQVLSRLGAFDQAERADLVPTLDMFLASGCSPQRTASAMGIHRNTVLYRLKRIEELADLNLTDTEARFYIQLALRAHRSFADERGSLTPPHKRAASSGS